ncbi:MAG TPA: DUF6427 family protein [Aquaticitalea sp.]|nr:DUF6427 family protein [Aquaticitalea sp.]HNU59074.1 DUF6427 family protein [Aquaticitalea sp.]
MVSSFFSQSRPIHFLVVSVFLLVIFVASKFYTLNEPLTVVLVAEQLFYFMIVIFSLFILDFFASRNKLTKKNSYKLLFFGLFMGMLPETLLNSNILLSNFFILLALRRIISLRTHKEIKKKLFDAGFWIAIATLFYFWASLFFILIFASIFLYSIINVKSWLVPFTGVLSVAIIWMALMLVTGRDFTDYFDTHLMHSLDFTGLNATRIMLSATILISYGTWASFFFINQLKDKSKKLRPSFNLVVISSIIALTIVLIAPDKNGSEFIFLFAPLSIILSNYMEITEETWFKEALIYVLILVPVVTLFF